MELKSTAHKTGINVHHLQWCTKYRYRMLRKPELKNACENAIRKQADLHGIVISELGVMPEHTHVSVELPPPCHKARLCNC